MTTLLTLMVSATLGALLRYYVTLWAATHFGATLYGTLLVNAIGSFILGFFLALAITRVELDSPLRLFVATGFCGSLTTFSTFSYETVALVTEGQMLMAALYALGSLVAGLLCVILGAALAHAAFPP